MKLAKVIKLLTDMDKRLKTKPDALRLNIKKIVLECNDDLVVTFTDKKANR